MPYTTQIPSYLTTMPPAVQAAAEKRMRRLLDTFKQHDPYIVFKIPKNDPNVIAWGESAVILGLDCCGESAIPVVGKAVGIEDKGDYLRCRGDFLPGTAPQKNWVRENSYFRSTVRVLKEFGLGAHVPFHVQKCYANRQEKIEASVEEPPLSKEIHFHLTWDLREAGKYDVYEAIEFDPSKAINGEAALQEFEAMALQIKEKGRTPNNKEWQKSAYFSVPLRHKKDPIRRMVLIRVHKKTKMAEVVLGDLDHLLLNRYSAMHSSALF